MRTFVVRALAVWLVATLAAVGVAVEAFETVADDVTVRRDAPITRNEVRHRLQERARDATGSNQADEKGGPGAATEPRPSGAPATTTPSTARVGPAEPGGPQTSTTHGQSSTTSDPPAENGGAGSTDSGGNGGGRADAPAGASQ